MKQAGNYRLKESQGTVCVVLPFKTKQDVENTRLIYDGKTHALLYLSKEKEPVILDYIHPLFREKIKNSKNIKIQEIDAEGKEQHSFFVEVHTVHELPPIQLTYSIENFLSEFVSKTNIRQAADYTAVLREDGLFFALSEQHVSVENPVLYYDGGEHALLGLSLGTAVILDYLNPDIKENLLNSITVQICECNSEMTNISKEYTATVQIVEKLPDFSLNTTIDDIFDEAITKLNAG